jgi:hypothetical protein
VPTLETEANRFTAPFLELLIVAITIICQVHNNVFSRTIRMKIVSSVRWAFGEMFITAENGYIVSTAKTARANYLRAPWIGVIFQHLHFFANLRSYRVFTARIGEEV